MGSNEDNEDSEKMVIMINLVPLGEKFENFSAYVTAQRLWLKQVPIKSSLFGDYKVLFVKYPGLPPSPPMPSSRNGNGGPYGHGNNGRDIKPLGVDISKQRSSNRLSGGIISIIVLSAVVAVVLVSVAVWVLLVKRREGAQSGHTPPATLLSVTKSSGVGGSTIGSGPESASLSFRSNIAYKGSAKTFSSSDMEKATDNFNELGVLGEGGFGRVYSGTLEDGTKVAVKVLKRDDKQGGREFLAEVEMLSRLHHRNLVRLLGICTEERNRCLVYELIPNGSVESHLHGIDKEVAPLDWGARLKIALGAARGLAYLHEDSSPRVIHRDFKSSNILLEHDFTPKVSDFGLARSALDEENQHISTRVMGTFGYVAPEYAMTGHLLVKSDVYSYGVVLLELLTGRKPVDMSMPSGQENLVAWARPLLPTPEGLNLLIDPSLSPEVPFDSIAKVAAIASMCVQPEVSHRPFMGEVVQALKLVCNECEETRDLGSRTCSHEDLTSLDFDPRVSTNSGHGPDPGPSHSTYPSYESPLDVESGFSGLGLDVHSYRITSSSGPLRPRRRDFYFSSGI
ncbi:receptor-like serine/threonine-protein kinase ALE2 isoform X1 [Tanacetum coccineum]